MPQRRINDAQTERLLDALQSLEYRQKLAAKLAKKENIKYSSAMRRLQRYVTEGAEKRTFARAPLDIRRATIKAARGRDLPVPADYFSKLKAEKQEPEQPPFLPRPRAPFYGEIEPSGVTPPRRVEPEARDVPDNYDYRAILAYFDGDASEAGKMLQEYGAGAGAGAMLELASTGTDIMSMRGIGRLADAVRDWQDAIPEQDAQNVQDFSDLFRDLPDLQIQMIIEDLASGNSSFAEWMDAWESDGYDMDAESSEYWKLWRAAYARAKK